MAERSALVIIILIVDVFRRSLVEESLSALQRLFPIFQRSTYALDYTTFTPILHSRFNIFELENIQLYQYVQNKADQLMSFTFQDTNYQRPSHRTYSIGHSRRQFQSRHHNVERLHLRL